MNEALVSLLIENISFQLRHPNYDRTVDVRNFSRMITTGEGQDAEVTRYRRYEDEALKKQRTRLYNPLTKYALARPRKYWKKMFRVEGIRRKFTTKDEARLTELQEQFYNFMPGESLEQWLNRTLEYLGVTDPNAWIVYERSDERDAEGLIRKTKVYPFVVSSVDAVNFERRQGVLQWLIARAITIERSVRDGYRTEKVLENYYLYAPGVIVRAREKGENTTIEAGEYEQAIMVYPPAQQGQPTAAYFDKTPSASGFPRNATPPTDGQPLTRTFYFSVIQNGTTEVPAECVGAYMDEVAGQGAFVAWFDPAEDVFRDLIRDKSVSDVLTITYAYPKTWEFAKRCTFIHSEYGECDRGYFQGIYDREHTCPNCNGTGIPANFSTEQQTLQIPLPDGIKPAEMLELAKMSFTQPVDIALLQHTDLKIETAEKRIMAAVFDSGLYQKPTNSQTRTATEVNAEMDGISDVLHPFGALMSRHFELAYRTGSQYMEFDLEVDHSFPEDLKIETLADMVAGFEAIKASGVGYEAMTAQRARVFQKTFEGSPDVQKQIAARYKFRPFDDKSDEDTMFIIASLAPDDNTRVLWAYWGRIFQEIEAENEGFADMSYERQRVVVQAKVDAIKAEMVLAGGETDENGQLPEGETPEDDGQTGTMPTVKTGEQFAGVKFVVSVSGEPVDLTGATITATFTGPETFTMTK